MRLLARLLRLIKHRHRWRFERRVFTSFGIGLEQRCMDPDCNARRTRPP